ncbi:MAG: HDOD domain-containing protein [Treponema sp.]|jgi:putative nucleotidyltransferase with HDIG domain|nr:HDOD domain-containing protein [Treponema sp.]
MQNNLTSNIETYIETMPSLPTSVTKVLEICNNAQTSPADLNQVISLDPVLVGRVLKLLNSAYYGLGQQITSLVRAIIMLGINTVKNLALSTAVMGSISDNKNPQGLNMEGFWRHSLCTGVTAKLIAKRRGIDPKQLEEYFTAGLLHDIGKVPINAAIPDRYMLSIADADREKIPLFRVEEQNLGINHCAAGAMIVRAWKLEGPAAEVIVHHHSPDEYKGNYQDILCTIIAADYFATKEEIGFSGSRFPEAPNDFVWQTLGAKEALFEGIEKPINEEINKAKVFLKI